MGAAVATVAGQIITAAISLAYLFRMKTVKLSKDSFPLRGRLMKQFLPLGFTSFLSQFSLVLSMAVMNNMIAKYGALSTFAVGGTADIPLAVQGIVMKYFQIVISIVVGMAAGCIPIVGFNFGARHYDRCRAMMKRLLGCEFLVGLAALALFQLFPVQLIGLFGTDNSPLYFQFAKLAFRIYLCMTPLDCVCKASFIFLQSLGKPVESTALSLIREVVLAVPLSMLLPKLVGRLFGLENAIYGLLLSMPVSVILTFVAALIIDLRSYRQLQQLEAKVPGTSKGGPSYE
jgi:Na+-driven multidrug efflux pump